MKMILAALMTILSLNAQAAFKACAPTVHAKSLGLHCYTDTHYYAVGIEIWKTDPKANCPAEHQIETAVADVDMFILDGPKVENYRLPGGQFEYQFMIGGNGATFRSDRFGLNLTCSAGIPGGGVSVGN